MSHEYEVEIDEVTLSEAETLVRMQDGDAGNDEDSQIAEKW
ncbi:MULTISPECIES: hypothetical protein [Stappia]|jgi:hypothetical protein|nr:hypothetical protein [Stappia stellulata]